jgi:Nucleotidyl transferase AbiEii toxin, Type IV TA system
LRDVLVEIVQAATLLSGIDFPQDRVEVRERADKKGNLTFEARVSYRGPLGIPTYPRVILDITRNEPVLDPPDARPVSHPYPDALPTGATVRTYCLGELLAEKTRALYQRTRPRDLYDIVYLLENKPEAFDLSHMRELFAQKCAAKSLKVPSSDELLEVIRASEELRSEWANMLAHQLPILPELDSLLGRLPDLLRWIDAPAMVLPVLQLAQPPISAREPIVAPAGIQYWGSASLEAIRFAGANRLLLEFTYNGRRRRAEPYSLRRTQTGNLLLYGWEEGSAHIKAFNTANMFDIRPTNVSFRPRYRIEFMPQGPFSAPSAAVAPRTSFYPAYRPARRAVRDRSPRRYGPTYVFQCPYCQKEFRHSTNDPKLRKHKRSDGYGDCPGRRGHLISIE